MKEINTPGQASKALNIPLTPRNKPLISTLKPKKKYHYTKKTGRPQKTVETMGLPNNWKEIIFESAAMGKSEVQIRASLCLTWIGKGKRARPKFHQGIWDALQERSLEFSSTIKISNVLCEAWWQNLGQSKVTHSTFEAFETAAWFINMKNRFGWRDKTEIDHGITDETFEKYKSMSVDDLNKKINELLPNRLANII